MEKDPEGKKESIEIGEEVLLEEQRSCLEEGKGKEVAGETGKVPDGDPKFPDHPEGGLWIIEIFSYRCGQVNILRSYSSDSLNELIAHGNEVCDEIETFFRIRPDDRLMEEKVKARDWAYQKSKDCFIHGPHHGVCDECKSDSEAIGEADQDDNP